LIPSVVTFINDNYWLKLLVLLRVWVSNFEIIKAFLLLVCIKVHLHI
jgi:hypothetical protein